MSLWKKLVCMVVGHKSSLRRGGVPGIRLSFPKEPTPEEVAIAAGAQVANQGNPGLFTFHVGNRAVALASDVYDLDVCKYTRGLLLQNARIADERSFITPRINAQRPAVTVTSSSKHTPTESAHLMQRCGKERSIPLRSRDSRVQASSSRIAAPVQELRP